MLADNGLRTLSELYAAATSRRIVALTDAGADFDLVYRIVASCALGCLFKRDSGIDEVRDALRKVAEGQVFLSSSALVSLVPSIKMPHARDPGTTTEQLDGLAGREYEMVDLIARSYPNRAIANQLVISDSTVRSHLQHIFEKLRPNRRVQVAAIALRTERLIGSSIV